ncbi:short chain dehydrogenase [Agromyces sp. SYSU T00194]|uniref:short chain dehydrogenase n=1 Tax=Agromyces chitinivorans TaxID=3158560 RepID=UPI0033942A48
MTQRTLVVGTSGTIGGAVVDLFDEAGYDVVRADYEVGDLRVDITDSASIAAMLDAVGPVDHIVCTVGMLAFAPIDELTKSIVEESIAGKLTSQVDLVLQGQRVVRDGGSFTLISGIMSRFPWRTGAGVSVANGGLDGFVMAAAAELGRDRRINAISPSILTESIEARGGVNPLPGYTPVPARRVAEMYLRSVSGIENGAVFSVD